MPKIISSFGLLIVIICALMLPAVVAQDKGPAQQALMQSKQSDQPPANSLPLYSNDVGVSAIISPPTLMRLDINYPIIIETTNFGTNSHSFNTIFQADAIDSFHLAICDTVYAALDGGATDTIVFADSISAHGEHDGFMNYAFTRLTGDQHAANDTIIGYSLYDSYDPVILWYGNIDRSPVEAYINNEIPIDLYFQGPNREWRSW